MVPSWLRRVRWSATASALAAVVALLGASAVASSVVASRQPVLPPVAGSASLASLSSEPPPTTAPVTTTTRVERRPAPVRPTTTTTSAPPAPEGTTLEVPATIVDRWGAGIYAPAVGATDVWFGTIRDPAYPCGVHELWRVPRRHPTAIAAVTADRTRLEELDPASGAVLGVLATWDGAARRPVGEGVTDVGAGSVPAISRDGRTLAFAAERMDRGDWRISCAPDLVLRDLASGAERVVPGATQTIDFVTALQWSPDDSSIAVTLSWEGSRVVSVPTSAPADLVLQSAPRLVGVDGWSGTWVDWLADGRLVLTDHCCYGDDEMRAGVLAAVGAGGGDPVAVGDEEGAEAVAVGPSGADVAYTRTPAYRDGPWEVVVRRGFGEPVVIATGYPDLDW